MTGTWTLPRPPRDRAFLAGLTALIVFPLVLGTIALRRPPWAPVLDMAMTELRVRDVGGSHTPLIGLPGRIGGHGVQGSHPGPLSFWLLAPTYRLFGSSAWALQVAGAVLDTLAIAVALVLGHRIGGRRVAAAVALVLAMLIVGYGLGPVIEPWNPYLPLLWWMVFLLSLWAAVLGDRPALLILVASGSLCAQTHVPYLGLCLGLGGLTAIALLARARRDPGERPSLLRWGLAAVVLGTVLWVPPTIDQLTEEPGNYGLLLDHFATPPEEPIGLREAGTQVLEHFDVGYVVVDQVREPGLLARGELGRHPVAWRGGVLLAGWLGLALLTWRRSPPVLRALHLVVAASTVIGWYSISRVFGIVWYYLMLWLWAVALLAVAASIWSVVAWRSPPSDSAGDPPTPPVRSRAVAGLVLLAALLSVRSAVVAPDTQPSDNRLSLVLDALMADTEAGLDAGGGAATGRDGRYVVGFSDALHIGSQAYGLVSELERRGFHAYMEPFRSVPITGHRTLDAAHATARVQLVTGSHIEEWRALDGVVEVASVDLRTPEDKAEQAALRAAVETELRAEGLAELIPLLDQNLFLAAIDQRASRGLQVRMDRMLRIGGPTSVFVAPPELSPP